MQSEACRAEGKADYATARAVCLNLTDAALRSACFADAKTAREEAAEECREERGARRELCAELGGGPYDPPFDPAEHDADFASPAHENPYFPLTVGDHWELAGEDETIVIDVLDETKLVDGVTCVVVRDRAERDGFVLEDTDDWMAQAKDGAVHYCGEISQSFELFPGDDPFVPELVSVDGSWKAADRTFKRDKECRRGVAMSNCQPMCGTPQGPRPRRSPPSWSSTKSRPALAAGTCTPRAPDGASGKPSKAPINQPTASAPDRGAFPRR